MEPFREILEDTAELLRRSAHPKKGTLRVSPEVAAMLDRIGSEKHHEDTHAGESRADKLAALEKTVSTCTKCPLSQGRTQTVFADGNPAADLVFVGEAPGEQEDLKGLPFVGRAGQLLTDIIVKGMNLKRSDVYICNVIKCRPPGNRDPKPEEKAQCEPFLIQQLELIQPKVICALGAHAARSLLKTDSSLGRLRGRWHFYRGIPVRVTYHPAYLLRSPSEKRKTWDDIREIMKVLNGETVPAQPFGI